MTSALVIGAGIGGLAAAGRLARQGFQVTLVEKAHLPGGRTGILEEKGYRFDTGPTYLLLPQLFAETYTALGEKMEDHLDLLRMDPTYRIHFHDGSQLTLSSHLEEMRAQLEELSPGAFGNFLAFISQGHQHYNLALKHFVGRNFNSLLDYFSPANIPLLFKLRALVSHARNTAHFFRDPRLQAAFSFQNMYLGLSPYEAPATFSLLQYSELADGVWFPRGGLYRVIETLSNIVDALGVRLLYSSPVSRILIEGDLAHGVQLEDGSVLRADLVVANADLPYVYERLLPQDGTAQKLSRKKYTSSALMFFWGLRGERSPQLLHHNIFLADHQFRRSFDQIFREHTLPDEPSLYICAPTRSDPNLAPANGDSLMALVPVGHLDDSRPQDWEALQRRARQTVVERLERLGVSNVDGRLELETQWGPTYYRDQLNLAKGSAFGLSHNFAQVGYLRPHNRHPRYPNLYFVGASTHPGTGLPIVLTSARLVVERILKEQSFSPPRSRSLSILE